MTMQIEFTEAGVLVLNCPDCAESASGGSPMIGVDGRWICKRAQHTRQMEPLDEAIPDERLEWERFETVLERFCAACDDGSSAEAKRAAADQMMEHLKRGKYLATVISIQGGDYWGHWWE